MNPLVNPGAIATTGAVQGKTDKEKWSKILATLEAFAGPQARGQPEGLRVRGRDEPAQPGDRRADVRLRPDRGRPEDGHRRLHASVFGERLGKDLAVMAGTLANGGKNPVTGKQVIDPDHVPNVLAVMATAGLYDDSGIWLYNDRPAREERRRRRHHRRRARQVRHRRVLAAARRGGQQRAVAARDPVRGRAARSESVRVDAALSSSWRSR